MNATASQPLYSLPIAPAVQPYQHYGGGVYPGVQPPTFANPLYQTPSPYTQPFMPPTVGLPPYAGSQYWGSAATTPQQHQQVFKS